MAIREVNAITRRGCAEAEEASRGRQLPASGIRAPAATESEHDGIRQRNTFGTLPIPYRAPTGACGRVGTQNSRLCCSG